MPLPSALPTALHARLASRAPSLPETLHLVTLPGIPIPLAILTSLPSSLVLPGGVTVTVHASSSLTALPPLESPIPANRPRALRWRTLASRSAAARARNAELVVVDSVPLVDGSALPDSAKAERPLLDVQFYDRPTQPAEHDAAEDKTAVGPYFSTRSDPNAHISGPVVDAIAYVANDASAADIRGAMGDAVDRLAAAIKALGCAEPVIRYYGVLDDSRMLAAVLASETEDMQIEDKPESIGRRLELHRALMLPSDRPLLRRAAAVNLDDADALAAVMNSFRIDHDTKQSDGGCPGRLPDVHLGIKAHDLGEKYVTVNIVRGRYLYCHYMQDGLSDVGWGCAYRSMQTLLSWCMSEGYASFPGGVLPDHLCIQQVLVDVGDKPAKFVGTSDWIGANEVCYALERLTGVASNILHVSRGRDMESKGRELARHFYEQGSPIMIGGGVLAWTILGVARDSRTGRTRFLILDPHYAGCDDLATIQAKGWVAWKAADIFLANTFYNLCMPIRPTIV
jgi:Peptidase family C78